MPAGLLTTISASSGLAVGGGTGGDRYDTQLPEGGKGSIEVFKVGPGHTSVCKIITPKDGRGLRVGDVVANLVYDRNVPFKFVVYGQFDLDYNNVPTLSDTATVRRLVTEWGGTVVPAATPAEVNADVDFIVVGIAPVVPILGAEDAGDPTKAALVEQKKKEREAYDNMLQRARELSIPVLNQTRFLYYTGYFDLRVR